MNNRLKGIYIAFFAVTISLFSGLSIWGFSGNSTNDLVTKKSEILNPDILRREYLVGEEIDLTGVEVKINDKLTVEAKDCTISYDFSSAGDKVVSLTYDQSNIKYVSSYMVEVFSIRHLDIREKEVYLDDDVWDFSNLVVWAELSGPTTEFNKPREYPDIDDTVIILNENQFEVVANDEQRSGYYTLTVNAGLASASFMHITNTEDPKVSSIERILILRNGSNTTDELTLFVTESSNNFAGHSGEGTVTASGIYVLKTASGETKQYNFSYQIDGWVSSFKSESFNQGLKDYQGYDGDINSYTVEIGEGEDKLIFYAFNHEWVKAILNNG